MTTASSMCSTRCLSMIPQNPHRFPSHLVFCCFLLLCKAYGFIQPSLSLYVCTCMLCIFCRWPNSICVIACIAEFVLLKLLCSQLCNKLLCPHMASLLHIQTHWWVTCSILTLLFSQCFLGTYSLLSVSHTKPKVHIINWKMYFMLFNVKFCDVPLKIFLIAHHVLTLNTGKLMTTPTTSLCQQCSNQA